MSDQDEEKQNGEKLHDYTVVFFDNVFKSWIENRKETDKQLLTLSALAIGLLIGAFGRPEPTFDFWIWSLSGFAYFACIVTIFRVFQQNNNYMRIGMDSVMAIINGNENDQKKLQEQEKEKYTTLVMLSTRAFVFFMLGAALTIWLALIHNPQ